MKIILVIMLIYLVKLEAFAQVGLLIKKDAYPKKSGDHDFKPLIDFQIEDSYLYAVENLSHKILIFSIFNGLNYVKFIGIPGRGNGEINLPTAISICDGKIAIKDDNAFSFFSLEGKFINEFKTYSSKRQFTFTQGKIFWFNSNPEDGHLIEVYSQEGKRLFVFGEKFISLNFSNFKGLGAFSVEKFAYDGKLLSDNEHVYYINKSLGNLIKFKLDGSKVLEANIGKIFENLGEKATEMNKLWMEKGIDIEKEKGIFRYYPIFVDAYLFENEIYLADTGRIPGETTGNEVVNFVALDKNTLKPNRKYELRKEKNDNVICFAVAKEKKALAFIVCMRTDDRSSVIEYREKN